MLHKLRQKTEYQKRKIAVVTSILVTGVIFVFWISSTIHSFSALDAEPGEVAVVSESPFNMVKENIASVYESMTKEVVKVKQQILKEE